MVDFIVISEVEMEVAIQIEVYRLIFVPITITNRLRVKTPELNVIIDCASGYSISVNVFP